MVELLGKLKDKLISNRERDAAAGKHLTGEQGTMGVDRLPPGQHRVEKWPVLDLGIQPEIDKDLWSLTIDGAVENPLMLDWNAFGMLPQKSQTVDIHCVTTWSRYDNRFDGVLSSEILNRVKPTPGAKFVIFHSYDGYTTNVTLDVFSDDDVMLSHSWQGKPLTREHGGPVRLVLPKWYFWKSAKWIKRIEFSEVDKPGFWEVRGYHNQGDPWKEDRYG